LAIVHWLLQEEMTKFYEHKNKFVLINPSRIVDPRIKHLFSTGDLSDITLVSQDSLRVKAHKCILSASLKYFNLMFSEKFSDRLKTEIEFKIPHKVLYETKINLCCKYWKATNSSCSKTVDELSSSE
jgi:hypothetical protein